MREMRGRISSSGGVVGEVASAGLPDIYVFVEFIPEQKLEALIPGTNALKSRKFASLLLNDIITKKSVERSAIHLVDDDRLSKANDAALVLRLPESFFSPKVIENAIEGYYK